MRAQPLTRFTKPRARPRNQAPVSRRVIEPLEVHQLVNHHVVAHPVGHGDESPVEADMSVASARTPSRPLISNADPGHEETVQLGERPQPRRQLFVRPGLEPLSLVGGEPPLAQLGALPLHPVEMAAGKGIGFPLRAAARNRDAQPAVVLHAKQIPARVPVADEVEGRDAVGGGGDADPHANRRSRLRPAERKPQLHLDRIPDSGTA